MSKAAARGSAASAARTGTAKVLVLAGHAHSLVNFRGTLLEELVGEGHDVVACAPRDRRTDELRPEVERRGATLEVLPLERRGVNPLEDLRTIRSLVSLYRRLVPDRVLAYMAKPVIYGGLAAQRVGGVHFVPMITGLGSLFGDDPRLGSRVVGGAARVLYRRALRSAACVVFQNPDDRDLFRSQGLLANGTPTVRVHGSGIDLDRFRAVPLPSRPTFLMLSRLLATKGVREYAQAAGIVRRARPDARFRLAGSPVEGRDGVDREEVERWAADGRVEYLGRMEDVRPALADARFVVLPSYYREGVPRSLLEALAVGRPVITTDTPGCRETVESGSNGRLVPPRSTEALAEAMLEVLQASDAAAATMGRASRRLAETRFDVRAVNGEIIRALAL